ncbi:hypothetical protein ABGV49_19845 [Chromobacterium vaccinii]|uniref:Uncharacterized protein n=1 Tax=Chromobacterium vaccinii TaxID=1108595 RepID=A0ABV0FJI9_9NEIS
MKAADACGMPIEFAATDYCDMAHKAMPVKQPVAKTLRDIDAAQHETGSQNVAALERGSAIA